MGMFDFEEDPIPMIQPPQGNTHTIITTVKQEIFTTY